MSHYVVVRQVAEMANEGEGDVKKFSRYTYPAMQKVQGSFTLDIEAGEFTDSEILARSAGPAPCRAQQALAGQPRGPCLGTPLRMVHHGAICLSSPDSAAM